MSQKPYVGIIYSRLKYNRISRGEEKIKKQLLYIEEAAKKNDVIPCFFRLDNIEPENHYIKAYVLGKNGYELQIVPRPTVIYNRGYDRKNVRPKIQQLIAEGITIFNVRNLSHGKFYIKNILSENIDISKQLPFTLRATETNIKAMMKKYNSLIIKPNKGSYGRGIMKLEKIEEKWCFTFTEKEGTTVIKKNIYFKTKLPFTLKKRIKQAFYIVQERIDLATYNNNPFDIRVAVQRNNNGEWETTSFITKVAQKGYYITNVAQGGTTYTLETILKDHPYLSYKQVIENTTNFTKNIANLLSKRLPHIGCLGMDIGIAKDGTPYFIEVNYISDFEGLTFQNNELVVEEWKKVFTTPIDYAAYLVKKKK
ncbi:YheC/YheD family protein [Halalkalibacter lacteus]|uniref:YheC/YheD family protein n=1 Tax=Halalkalibacter lacteus TaxID=3090663 RepID=UPI002FC897C8